MDSGLIKDIKISLNKLEERIEALEGEVDSLKDWKSEVSKQFIVVADIFKKQKEWNNTAEESISLLNKLIELKTGGKK